MDISGNHTLYGRSNSVFRILKGKNVKFKAFSTAIAALSLVAAPTIAAAAPVATPLTQPATESVNGDNALAGGGIFIALLAVAAVAAGIVVVATENNDTATSP